MNIVKCLNPCFVNFIPLVSGFALLVDRALGQVPATTRRPNILLAVSDDQSYPHASAYGYDAVSTPAFDRVARQGVLFSNAFTPAPGCSPMRAAFLTGRNLWQLEEAGTHASSFPKRYDVFPDRLRLCVHSLPEKLLTPGTNIHGRPRHKIDYTDNAHPTHESYIKGNPSERALDYLGTA